jgi:tRNA (adenine58-N1)-methyltransferase non-catalytic subunit
MRIDTVAQILTYSNVAAYRNVLILENCKGLLVASVVERLGGFGSIINLSPNGVDNGSRQTLAYMNFKEALTDVVQNFPLEKIDKLDVRIPPQAKNPCECFNF